MLYFFRKNLSFFGENKLPYLFTFLNVLVYSFVKTIKKKKPKKTKTKQNKTKLVVIICQFS